MGVLPLQFQGSDSAASLGLKGDENFDLLDIETLTPGQQVTLAVRHADGRRSECRLLLRIDTPIEVDYYLHGGILPYVLRELLATG